MPQSSRLADLSPEENEALRQLKRLLQKESLDKANMGGPSSAPEELSIWGIPLLGDARSDPVLLKFLDAKGFDVKEAFGMLISTLEWRKEFGVDNLVSEEDHLGVHEFGKVLFTHGFDTDGHPVVYTCCGEFQNDRLCQSAFSDDNKLKFVMFYVQFMERLARNLDFGTNNRKDAIIQVVDLKNVPSQSKCEDLWQCSSLVLLLIQKNYPGLIAKKVFINVPWQYVALSKRINLFIPKKLRSHYIFARQSKSTKVLRKYISPEQLPLQYRGTSTRMDDVGTSGSNTAIATDQPDIVFYRKKKTYLYN